MACFQCDKENTVGFAQCRTCGWSYPVCATHIPSRLAACNRCNGGISFQGNDRGDRGSSKSETPKKKSSEKPEDSGSSSKPKPSLTTPPKQHFVFGLSTQIDKLTHRYPMLAPLYLGHVKYAAYRIDRKIQKLLQIDSGGAIAEAFCDIGLLQWLNDLLTVYVMYGISRVLNKEKAKLNFGKETTLSTALGQLFKFHGGNFYTFYSDKKTTISNEDAKNFFKIDPKTSAWLDRITINFVSYLGEIMRHLAKDFPTLKKMFGSKSDPIEKLDRLDLSGSDLHKHGKQVILMRFTTGKGRKLKIVYKPSDILIDMCLVGELSYIRLNSDSFSYLPTKPMSLCEILNKNILEPHKLPTYRILPRKIGTTKAYGYIEFITYDAEVDERQAKIFYVIYGQLMAIATTFGLRDFHISNLIAHGGKPYLIDLEMAFGKVDSLGETNLIGNNSAAGGHTINRPGDFNISWNGKSFGVGNDLEGREETGKNRIFLEGTKKLISPGDYRNSMAIGFQFMMKKLANESSIICKWMVSMKLHTVVVRHLISTAGIQNDLEFLRESDVSLEDELQNRRKEIDIEDPQSILRYMHIFSYVHGDLPSYYFRPTSSPVLMNSDYQTVLLPDSSLGMPGPGSVFKVAWLLGQMSGDANFLRQRIEKFMIEILKGKI